MGPGPGTLSRARSWGTNAELGNYCSPNPVLAGSHPDLSILRVGSDFYLATSMFEWCPGVRLHHSRDLVHWRALGGALESTRLLDLTGCPDSGGVWAPNLSYADGLFHLIYSNVSTYSGGFTDCPNYGWKRTCGCLTTRAGKTHPTRLADSQSRTAANG